jgi:signal transduction histidine kinase
LIVIRDVTEEHELARIRQDTLHMLVHDLRAPLAVLHGSLGMMKMALEDGELDGLPEMIKLAYQGSERMGRLVGQLLEIGRLEDEHLQLHPTWISLTDLFDEVIRQVQPAADESHIALERLETGELPEIFVDGEQLFRVIFNLLDNAIKFTPDQGRVVIWTRLEPDRKPMSVLTGVTDTGQGITEELRETLFAKFSRGKAVKSRRAGSGLGLHFCKLAVEAHGGQIWVESQPGRGSTFFIRLPVA